MPDTFLPKKIIIHHSGTDDGPDVSWGAIRKWHIEHNGWKNIGYHAGIELTKSGGEFYYEILIGRPWTEPGAHCLSHNFDSLGLCFIGNFELMPPPEPQVISGASLIKMWMKIFGISIGNVYPHKAFNDTDCPGKFFDMDKLKSLCG